MKRRKSNEVLPEKKATDVINELDALLSKDVAEEEIPVKEEPIDQGNDAQQVDDNDDIDILLGAPAATKKNFGLCDVIDLVKQEDDSETDEEPEIQEIDEHSENSIQDREIIQPHEENEGKPSEQKPDSSEVKPAPHDVIDITDEEDAHAEKHEKRTATMNNVDVSYEVHRPKRNYIGPAIKIKKPALCTYVLRDEDNDQKPAMDESERRGFDSESRVRERDLPTMPITSNISLENECLHIEFEHDHNDLIGGAMCLFYTQSPFSDSAPHPFLIDGRYYYTLEHFFHIQMLYNFGMFKLASEMMRIPSPRHFRRAMRQGIKELIKTEKVFDEKMIAKWKIDNGPATLRKGNRAKFEQNFKLKQLLMHTGERIMLYASGHDRLFGIGMTEAEFLMWTRKNKITIEDLLDVYTGVAARPRELGQNVLGIALMEVRAELMNATSVLIEWRRAHHEMLSKSDYQQHRRHLRTEPLDKKEKMQARALQQEISRAARDPSYAKGPAIDTTAEPEAPSLTQSRKVMRFGGETTINPQEEEERKKRDNTWADERNKPTEPTVEQGGNEQLLNEQAPKECVIGEDAEDEGTQPVLLSEANSIPITPMEDDTDESVNPPRTSSFKDVDEQDGVQCDEQSMSQLNAPIQSSNADQSCLQPITLSSTESTTEPPKLVFKEPASTPEPINMPKTRKRRFDQPPSNTTAVYDEKSRELENKMHTMISQAEMPPDEPEEETETPNPKYLAPIPEKQAPPEKKSRKSRWDEAPPSEESSSSSSDDDEEMTEERRAEKNKRRAARLLKRAKAKVEAVQEAERYELDKEKPVITVLKDQRRIIISRKTQEEIVEGADENSDDEKEAELAASQVKQASYDRIAQRKAEASVRMTMLMQKLHELSNCEKPMVNPFSVPTQIADQAQECTGDEPDIAPEDTEVFIYQRPPGRPYELESGELPPPGVVMPPPGLDNEPPILLPLSMREWIPQPNIDPSRPAALPEELLPMPRPPPGIDPIEWRQRFDFAPRVLPAWAQDSPMGKYPLEMRRPRCIEAPRDDPTAKFYSGWEMPENPVLYALQKARKIMSDLRKKQAQLRQAKREQKDQLFRPKKGSAQAHQRRMERLKEHLAAGGTEDDFIYENFEDDGDFNDASTSILDDASSVVSIREVIAKDQTMFPFGMMANQADMQNLGFVPPPIIGDPEAQKRNKMKSKDWINQFSNPKAIIRHHANRWVRSGRMNTTGEYIEYETEDEQWPEDDIFKNQFEEEPDDEDHLPPKRKVESQVVFVDTSQYDDYVLWYQKMHGYAPLPETQQREADQLRAFYAYYRTAQMVEQQHALINTETDTAVNSGDGGEKKLERTSLSTAYGNHYAQARWRWAQWERYNQTPEAQHWRDIKQEVKITDSSISGAPIKYEVLLPEDGQLDQDGFMKPAVPRQKRSIQNKQRPVLDVVEVTPDKLKVFLGDNSNNKSKEHTVTLE